MTKKILSVILSVCLMLVLMLGITSEVKADGGYIYCEGIPDWNLDENGALTMSGSISDADYMISHNSGLETKNVTTIMGATQPTGIPSDANTGEFNGHTYCVFDLSSGWKEAKEYCESLGGHLATITSKEENDSVYEFVKQSGYRDAFFGFTDEAEEGTWQWVTGEPVDYTNWKDGEPNDDAGTEDYAMFYHNYEDKWNDWNFSEVTAFICEWDQSIPEPADNAVQEKYSFTDVPTDAWYYPAVTRAVELGYVTGYEDGSFKPDATISRAECVTLISRFCGDEPTNTSPGFNDVSDGAWYSQYVALRGKELGGSKGGQFLPDQPCNRADFAVGLYHALGFDNQTWEYDFSDFSQIPDDEVYRNAIFSMGVNQVMNGDSNGKFNPQKSISRAEAAQVFCNLADAGLKGIPAHERDQDDINKPDKTKGKIKEGNYKWHVRDDSNEVVGACVVTNVTVTSADIEVSHSRSNGVNDHVGTAYLQEDGTYVAYGEWSGVHEKTHEYFYEPVKYVFTVIDDNTIKMDQYNSETGKELEQNVIFKR